ncbi:MAG: hypothetical protein Q8O75_03585 [bacterium]|nr:hypothetical protein [bacterium]
MLSTAALIIVAATTLLLGLFVAWRVRSNEDLQSWRRRLIREEFHVRQTSCSRRFGKPFGVHRPPDGELEGDDETEKAAILASIADYLRENTRNTDRP